MKQKAAKKLDEFKRLNALSERNWAFIRQNADSLLSEYSGRFIAINEGKVIKVGKSQQDVDDYVRANFADIMRAIPRGSTEGLCSNAGSKETQRNVIGVDLRNYNKGAKLSK